MWQRIPLRKPPRLGIIEPDAELEEGEIRILIVRVVAELSDVLVGLADAIRVVSGHVPPRVVGVGVRDVTGFIGEHPRAPQGIEVIVVRIAFDEHGDERPVRLSDVCLQTGFFDHRRDPRRDIVHIFPSPTSGACEAYPITIRIPFHGTHRLILHRVMSNALQEIRRRIGERLLYRPSAAFLLVKTSGIQIRILVLTRPGRKLVCVIIYHAPRRQSIPHPVVSIRCRPGAFKPAVLIIGLGRMGHVGRIGHINKRAIARRALSQVYAVLPECQAHEPGTMNDEQHIPSFDKPLRSSV